MTLLKKAINHKEHKGHKEKDEGIVRDCPKTSTKKERILRRILKIFVLFVSFVVVSPFFRGVIHGKKLPIVIFSCIFSLLVLLGCRASPDTLGRVLDAGVLRVGMDASFPPFEYVDGAGNLVGFDVDMAWEMARRMGDRLPDDREMAVQFVANLPYDGLYDALTAQRVDVVVSALYVDDARRATHAFSAPYFDAGQVLVAAGGVTGTDDLAGRTLAVEWGSEGDVTARAWERRIGDLTILPAQTAAEALAWAASGQADAALVDHLSAWGATGAGSGLRVVGEPVTSVPYAIAARIEDGRLIRYLNELLAEMEADGTLEALRVRWFR